MNSPQDIIKSFRKKSIDEIASTAHTLERDTIPLSALIELLAGEAFQEAGKTAPIKRLREAEIEYGNGLRAALNNARQSIWGGRLTREPVTLMPINSEPRIQLWCHGNGTLETLQYWRPVVKIENAIAWLNDLGVPVPSWLAHPAKAAPPKKEAPQPKGLIQEKCILEIIAELGYDPKALPKNQNGKPGPKSRVRSVALKNAQMFTRTSFDHTWRRLFDSSEIAYRQP
jgi:hypothetical protein